MTLASQWSDNDDSDDECSDRDDDHDWVFLPSAVCGQFEEEKNLCFRSRFHVIPLNYCFQLR